MDFHEETQLVPCPECRHLNSTNYDICSNCGFILHAKSIRIRGAILVGLGLLLSVGMSYLLMWIALIIRQSADPRASVRFSGSSMAAAAIFALLGFILLFGIVCIVMGSWMARHGYRNSKLTRIVWTFAVIFWILGVGVWVFDLFYGNS